jgi:galactose mutarotase-like enzyme
MDQTSMGTTSDGQQATLYTLSNAAGLVARITDYGATLVQLWVPDAAGQSVDVVSGFDDVSEYASPKNAKFGATIGPVTNRIGQGRFTLNGQTYQLTKNHGPHTLHSGDQALDGVIWSAEAAGTDAEPALRLTYTHPDGRDGFPGHLQVTTTYTVTQANSLRIDWEATTDQPTPVNMTNHAYFNLAGHDQDTVADHMLTLHANQYTPTDEDSIPTGAVASVKGTPLDFTQRKLIGDGFAALQQQGQDNGFDQNFMVDEADGSLRPVAEVQPMGVGRLMRLYSTQPCVQFYTAGNLAACTGKAGATYRPLSLFCLETQHPPDAVNHDHFPSIILQPGERYHHVAEYCFETR